MRLESNENLRRLAIMKCPACGKGCVLSASEVLADIDSRYMACPHCPPEQNLDKTAALRSLPVAVERCPSCGKATLDAVMLDVLRVLQEFRLRDEMDTLRSVGSPLLGVGYPLPYPPRLGPRSLIIMGERLRQDAAQAVMERIPEVKGVIQSQGVAGLRDCRAPPLENVLLAGCDLRADVVQSLFGELVIYRSQSRIHIEFSRAGAPKMKILEQLYLRGKLQDVADGLCGPGTLGLMCTLAGARRVVMNDAWLPAVENVLLNLEVNRSLLGIEEMECPETPRAPVGQEPVLVCRARGACEIEVYHGDLKKLFSRARPARLCLIDHFPGMDTKELEKACGCCKEIVIV